MNSNPNHKSQRCKGVQVDKLATAKRGLSGFALTGQFQAQEYHAGSGKCDQHR
jgi:hypothetical protein